MRFNLFFIAFSTDRKFAFQITISHMICLYNISSVPVKNKMQGKLNFHFNIIDIEYDNQDKVDSV
jgi:hypothetical protein